MRVYELAKKLGMENRDLIPALKRLGFPVASHSSALDEAAVEKAMAELGPKAPTPGKGVEKKEPASRKAGTPERDTTKGAPLKTAPAALQDEASKPDKKRILIKRKKSEEDLVAEEDLAAPVSTTAEGAGAAVQEPSAPAPPPAHEAAPVVLPPTPTAPSAPSPVASAPPESGVTVERPGEPRKGMTFEPVPGETPAGKEKGKRLKKPGRTREDQDLRFREDAARWQDLRAIPMHRREDRTRHGAPTPVAEITKPRKKAIGLSPGLTVKDFAESVGQRPADVIRKLMELGQMLTMNQPMPLDTAHLIAEGYGVRVELADQKTSEDLLEEAVVTQEEERPEPRPPVVTIMGHVDHGKTSLLDAIRETRVTEQEAGGITQHIGAYTVSIHDKRVTFLDTPGHEAFTAMRARGAKATDIVVLVVAADDGVMPQTVEAINHASAAGVPIIVAINKIDKPGANIDRVRNALAEHNLIPEAWGGQTIFVEVSAKQKLGLNTLLEMILLQAEVLELKADPHRMGKGTVVEAKLDRGRGPVATVLVQTGSLKVGDAFVVGSFSGRVRALLTDTGAKVQEAGPSIPVEVVGLLGVPEAGDAFVVVRDERLARQIADERAHRQRIADLAAAGSRVTLDDLYARIKEGDVKELAIVIKADVQGSAEALSEAVEKLPTAAVKLRVIHKGVGGITETDILLASASRAIIIGFNVRPEPKAAALAEREGVDIRLYTIIYDAIADIKAAMEGLLEPILKERVLGRAEVRQVFSIAKVGTIGGCYVLDGTIARSAAGVRVIRDSVQVYQGRLGSLRRFKDDVREVQQGYECGIGVENFNDLKVGDILEVFTIEKIAANL